MTKKYLDENGLSYFWGKVKNKVPTKTSDLSNDSNFVSNTDYASSEVGGVIKLGQSVNLFQNGLACNTYSYSNYYYSPSNYFVSKGTLENVITGKKLEEVSISTTQPTDTSEIWIDPNDVPSIQGSYISNTYGTSQTIGYSQEYVNSLLAQKDTYSTSEVKTNKIFNNKPVYRKVIIKNNIGLPQGNGSWFAHNISNINVITDFNVIFDNNGTRMQNYIFDSDGYKVFSIDNTNVNYWGTTYFGGGSGRIYYFFIEYTKTTD